MTHTVCVPSSVVREAEDKREATRKLGYVARAATVFRADRLVVFPDGEGDGRRGGEFVTTVLEYAATPPYLRREVWGRREELEYVGVLPPLRVASRTGSDPDGSESIRQGIVTEVGPEGRVRVTCGLQHPISLLAPDREPAEGERVTVRISSREPVRARIVDEAPPGFAVERTGLPEALGRDDAGVRIATSRHGRELTAPLVGDLAARTAGGRSMTVAFGSPGRGLPEILGLAPESVVDGGGPPGSDGPVEPDPGFDLWLNTVPQQGSEVVRTEEAMFASLAPLTLTE